MNLNRADVFHEEHRTAVHERVVEPDHHVNRLARRIALDRHAGELGEADGEIVVGAGIIGAPPLSRRSRPARCDRNRGNRGTSRRNPRRSQSAAAFGIRRRPRQRSAAHTASDPHARSTPSPPAMRGDGRSSVPAHHLTRRRQVKCGHEATPLHWPPAEWPGRTRRVALPVRAVRGVRAAPARRRGATAAQQRSGRRTAAVINGETITEDQVLKAAAADLQKLASRPPADRAHDRAQTGWPIMHKALDAVAEEKTAGARSGEAADHAAADCQGRDDSNVVVPSDEDVVGGLRTEQGAHSARRATRRWSNCVSR